MKKKTADKLLKELRLEAQKHGHTVFNILIRRAGVGIQYAKGETEDPYCFIVYTYWPTLQEALEFEIEEWKAGKR